MPRHVRNFWLELIVDGKKHRVATGSRAKDGGFALVISMRNRGVPLQAMRITGRTSFQGRVLELRAVAIGTDKALPRFTLHTQR